MCCLERNILNPGNNTERLRVCERLSMERRLLGTQAVEKLTEGKTQSDTTEA